MNIQLKKHCLMLFIGMSVTNNIRDNVLFNNKEWKEEPLTNDEIINLLEKQKQEGFMSYSWGVWVTAYARKNLLENLIKQDKFVIYADTDSLKLQEGFDENLILDYNKNVLNKIKNVAEKLELDVESFMPKDNKGIKHPLGVFEKDAFYTEFITQGAKKYAYIDSKDNKIHITVSGVPKSGAVALNKLEDFRDDFVFEYKYTNKNLIAYTEEMSNFMLTDFQGNKKEITEKYGCCLLPTTYSLGISQEYAELISDDSSKHAKYIE